VEALIVPPDVWGTGVSVPLPDVTEQEASDPGVVPGVQNQHEGRSGVPPHRLGAGAVKIRHECRVHHPRQRQHHQPTERNDRPLGLGDFYGRKPEKEEAVGLI